MNWMDRAEQAFERGYNEGVKDAQKGWEAEKAELIDKIDALNVGIAELHHILDLVTKRT